MLTNIYAICAKMHPPSWAHALPYVMLITQVPTAELFAASIDTCASCQQCAWLLPAVSCDCHTSFLFCCQDYPSIGLVAKLLNQENVVPLYMVTSNREIEETYGVGLHLLPSLPLTASCCSLLLQSTHIYNWKKRTLSEPPLYFIGTTI